MLLLNIFEMPEVNPYIPLTSYVNYKGKQQFDLKAFSLSWYFWLNIIVV